MPYQIVYSHQASTVWINNFGVLDASVPICGRNSTGYGCFLGKEGQN